LFVVLALGAERAMAQLSDLHYLPPLHARANQVDSHFIYISTPHKSDISVDVKRGDGSHISGSPFTVSNAKPLRINAGSNQNNSDIMVPQDSLLSALHTKGVFIEADSPVYVNARYRSGTIQAESITTKGKSAMGREFRLGFMPQQGDQIWRNFVFSLMATEDATEVVISDYDDDVTFDGPVTRTDDTLYFTLNKGQTVVVSGNTNNTYNWEGMIGALISSDKDVVVNTGNWLGSIASAGGQDIALDQIVPVHKLGTEHVVIEAAGHSDQERPLVVAPYNSTAIYLNGDNRPYARLNAGEWVLLPNNFYTGSSHRNMYVRSTRPVYVYQMMAGARDYTTPGMNFIPPIRCGLSNSLDLIPDIDRIGSATYNGSVIVLSEKGSGLWVNGIKQSGAEAVTGNNTWETYRINGFRGDVKVEGEYGIAGGFFGYSGAAGYGAYFSGFSDFVELDMSIDNRQVCQGEAIRVTYSGDTSENAKITFSFPGSDSVAGSGMGPFEVFYRSAGVYRIDLNLELGSCRDSEFEFVEVFPEYKRNLNISACDSFFEPVKRGMLRSDLQYTDTFRSISGCDSVVTVNLDIKPSQSSLSNTFSCDSFYWASADSMIYQSGLYSRLFVNQYGCDSLVELDLQISKAYKKDDVGYSCDSFFWQNGDTLIRHSGLYQKRLLTTDGCDSILTLDVLIGRSTLVQNQAMSCDSFYWDVNGSTLYSSGIYSDTFTNLEGCDSIMYLELELNPSFASEETQSECDSFRWDKDGNWYFQSGMYEAAYTSAFGCDSSYELNLSLFPSYFFAETETACDAFTWAVTGEELTATGLYTESFTSVEGCDSVHVLDLTVSTSSSSSEVDSFCEQYDWRLSGERLFDAGTYEFVTTNAEGCDSTITLFLQEAPYLCECTVHIPTAFSPNGDRVNDLFQISHNCQDRISDFELRIYNRWGELLYHNTNPTNLSWDGLQDGKGLPSGLYPYMLQYKLGLVDKQSHYESGVLHLIR
jgi:gliding motility-associated-like protein